MYDKVTCVTGIRNNNPVQKHHNNHDDQNMYIFTVYATFHFFNKVYLLHRFREGITGEGARAEASMFLYRTSDYREVYPAGQVTLPVGSPLYVGVSLDEQYQGFVVVLEDCYASHSPNPDQPTRQNLIQNKCVPRFVLCHGKETDV